MWALRTDGIARSDSKLEQTAPSPGFLKVFTRAHPHLRASAPLCPIDPGGERGHAHNPWLFKWEISDLGKLAHREVRMKMEACCDRHQPPGVTNVVYLRGQANLHTWKRLLGDFQMSRPFLLVSQEPL